MLPESLSGHVTVHTNTTTTSPVTKNHPSIEASVLPAVQVARRAVRCDQDDDHHPLDYVRKGTGARRALLNAS